MTTIVAVRKDKQIVIAADRLTTYGSVKESAKYVVNSSKILRLGDTYFGLSGEASWDIVLTSYYNSLTKKPKLDSISAIYEFARVMHPVLLEEHYLHPEADKDDDFDPTNIMALIVNKHGIFILGRYRYVQEYTRFYAMGNGREFALGAMFTLYDTEASAKEIAKAGVTAGCEFDEDSEGPIEVKTIALE